MAINIVVILGHPDTAPHLCHALADAYQQGAEKAGHAVRMLAVTQLEFPLIRSRKDWEDGEIPADIQQAQRDLEWAEHLVFIYPLWLGTMPALLKAFLEQVARPAFVSFTGANRAYSHNGLRGKSCRIIVTMGMPGLIYRWYFGAHSLKSFKRNILGFVGVKPIRTTIFGMVEEGGALKKQKWLAEVARLGTRAR